MTLPQKLKIVEKVLDEDVRFFLQNDGGDCTVQDIQGNLVYIEYLGACNG